MSPTAAGPAGENTPLAVLDSNRGRLQPALDATTTKPPGGFGGRAAVVSAVLPICPGFGGTHRG